MKPSTLIFACVLFLSVQILLCLVAPLLVSESVNRMDLARRLEGPSRQHWFGTDELGRDIFSRILYGGRTSFLVSLSVITLCLLIGVILGTISGMRGGWPDEVIMRSGDVLLSFPGVLLAIGLMAVLGPSLRNVVLALVMIGWVSYARLCRGLVLKLRELEFVHAARSLGASSTRILFKHLLPNMGSALIVQTSFGFAGMILAESSLSFLGLGVQPPVPSWGNMLSDGKNHLLDAPHLTVFPGLAIFVSVLALNLLGDALRDHLDPKEKLHHGGTETQRKDGA